MKLIILLILGGCDLRGHSKDASNKYNLPSGLSDCNVYYIGGENGDILTAIRCPNSSTATNYQTGKTRKSVSTIERKTK